MRHASFHKSLISVFRSITVFRNHRDSRNLTGRFNSPSANCVTFFGQCRYMRIILIGVIKCSRFGIFLTTYEGLTV
jgi:hypothetical protein